MSGLIFGMGHWLWIEEMGKILCLVVWLGKGNS